MRGRTGVPREPAAEPAGLLTPGSLGRLGPAGLRGLGEDAGGGQERRGVAHGPTGAQSVSGTMVCKAGQSAGWVGRRSHGKGLWTRLWAR